MTFKVNAQGLRKLINSILFSFRLQYYPCIILLILLNSSFRGKGKIEKRAFNDALECENIIYFGTKITYQNVKYLRMKEVTFIRTRYSYVSTLDLQIT